MTIATPVIPSLESAEVIIAKDQPEYAPIPALKASSGKILMRLEFSAADLACVLNGGSLYLCFLTFNQPMQPVIAAIAHHVEESPDAILGHFGLVAK